MAIPDFSSLHWFQWVMIAVYFVLLGRACLFCALGLISTSWPSTTAVIDENELVKDEGGGEGGGDEVRFRYRFRIDGPGYSLSFQGSLIHYGYVDLWLTHAARERCYPVGKRFPVYYLSAYPKICVLRPGIRLTSVFVLLILVVVGLWYLDVIHLER